MVAVFTIGFFSFGLWAHIFTIGIPSLPLAFLAASTVPSLFVLGFRAMFD